VCTDGGSGLNGSLKPDDLLKAARELPTEDYVLNNRDGRIGAVPAIFNIDSLRFADAPKEPSEGQWRDYIEPRGEGE